MSFLVVTHCCGHAEREQFDADSKNIGFDIAFSESQLCTSCSMEASKAHDSEPMCFEIIDCNVCTNGTTCFAHQNGLV